MKSALPIVLFAGIAAASFDKHLIGSSSLWQRDFCSGESCASCYGPGNIICQSTGTVESCFNPSGGEQCCANGDYCVGADTSCCGSVGAGITVTAEPTQSQSSPSSQTQSAPEASGSTWQCESTDSNEQCCQRGGSINLWCSGEDPRQCYRPSLGEECCADGSVCQGSGCCVTDGSSPTTPNPVEATSVPDSGSSSLNLNTGNAFPSQTSSSSQTTRQLSIPGASSPTSTGQTVVGSNEAAPRSIIGGAFAALVGFVGMALL